MEGIAKAKSILRNRDAFLSQEASDATASVVQSGAHPVG